MSKQLLLTAIILLIFLLIALNICLGSVYIPLQNIIDILSHRSDNIALNYIILDSRLPQILTAILAGTGLAICGLLMQTLLNNPLAEPSILGISSGANIGVAIIILGLNTFSFNHISTTEYQQSLILLSAFIGAICTLIIILLFARKIHNNSMLLIIGIMIGYLASSFIDILKYFSDKETLQNYINWGFASFSNTTWQQLQILAPIVVVGCLLSLGLSKPLNALLLGENYAQNLGINLHRIRITIILLVGIMIATITAFCGPIAFLGLAIPHITKMILKTSDHLRLMIWCILIGICITLTCNLAARMPGCSYNLPINAITSIIGAPIVISVILKQNRHNF